MSHAVCTCVHHSYQAIYCIDPREIFSPRTVVHTLSVVALRKSTHACVSLMYEYLRTIWETQHIPLDRDYQMAGISQKFSTTVKLMYLIIFLGKQAYVSNVHK